MSLKSGKSAAAAFPSVGHILFDLSPKILHDVSASFRIYYPLPPLSIYLLFGEGSSRLPKFSFQVGGSKASTGLSLSVCVYLSICLELVVGGSCLATLDKQELIDWHPAAAAHPSFAH